MLSSIDSYRDFEGPDVQQLEGQVDWGGLSQRYMWSHDEFDRMIVPDQRPAIADLFFVPAFMAEAHPHAAIVRGMDITFPSSDPPKFVDFGFGRFAGEKDRKYKGDPEDSLDWRSYQERVDLILAIMRDRVRAVEEMDPVERRVYVPRSVFVGQSLGANAAGIAQAYILSDLMDAYPDAPETVFELMPRVQMLSSAVSPFYYEANVKEDSKGFRLNRGKVWTPEMGDKLTELMRLRDKAVLRYIYESRDLAAYRFFNQSRGDALLDQSVVRAANPVNHDAGGVRYSTASLEWESPISTHPMMEHLRLADNPRDPDPEQAERHYARIKRHLHLFREELLFRSRRRSMSSVRWGTHNWDPARETAFLETGHL